ncbi:hypothetical protein F5Y10DRAFT_285484 [Nemania abortiva]|nr:hypothetical protein F5Y10DRAFT_285484 [Nemania abortiva]
MEAFRSMRNRALSHVGERRVARERQEERQEFNYCDNLYGIVDQLIWTAVRYADGPMRRYIRRDPMFTEFRQNVQGFEALFRSDRHPGEYDGPSKGIPVFIRQYLHQKLEMDLEWLDGQFFQDENCHLVYALLHNMIEMHGFKVGIVIRLVIHLLQLIPLYGPAERPSRNSGPSTTRRESNAERGVGYHSSYLVMKSIGNAPQFLWVRTGITRTCYFAVSHRNPGSMDRCWLNPENVRGSTPYVKINPAYYGKTEASSTHSDDHNQIMENYDSPDDLLCIFRGELAALPILDPRSDNADPSEHQYCLRMLRRRIRSARPIIHGEIDKSQDIQDPKMAKRWTALCKDYWGEPRRGLGDLLSKIRSPRS